METGLLRTVLWQRRDEPGLERCELSRHGSGWRLAGTVLTVVAGEPAAVRYDVTLDPEWRTRDVVVASRFGGESERRLRVTVDAAHGWRIDREPADDQRADPDDVSALDGLVDIDLGITPATNTLPIRRLAPAIGEAVEVTAAWVRFPEWTIEPLPQRYVRLSDRRYRYESGGGSFVAELDVDELGLVVDYAGGWRRLAEAGPGR